MKFQKYERESNFTGAVVFNDIEEKEYKKLVLDQPRPYDVIMFFNLKPEEAAERCVKCVEAEKQLPQLIYSYHKYREKTLLKQSPPKHLFFGIMYVD
jgi:hypothetical protein